MAAVVAAAEGRVPRDGGGVGRPGGAGGPVLGRGESSYEVYIQCP